MMFDTLGITFSSVDMDDQCDDTRASTVEETIHLGFNSPKYFNSHVLHGLFKVDFTTRVEISQAGFLVANDDKVHS